MPDTPVVVVPTETFSLPPEWIEAAEQAARNLGQGKPLAELSPEHWQLVLASVTDRMLLHGETLPPGWRRTLAQQVGRQEAADRAEARVLALHAKREEIAAHIARDLGLGGLAGLSRDERAAVDQQTTETIEGCDPASPEPTDCSEADRTMRRLLSEHHALKDLQADEVDA
ncbi:hypothetical protein [Methylobacterium sp. J-070]|uniref:hypothetical protein n=1 Tax=Methylobacterium sp. J-070 TaxID=2836650 RepID=UPI001FBA6983|nr:hypothetical protein [Methylobacterium sp. J-070]MCJ2054767.1 hypothetical protein [Methylobacterium sp. J-070]